MDSVPSSQYQPVATNKSSIYDIPKDCSLSLFPPPLNPYMGEFGRVGDHPKDLIDTEAEVAPKLPVDLRWDTGAGLDILLDPWIRWHEMIMTTVSTKCHICCHCHIYILFLKPFMLGFTLGSCTLSNIKQTNQWFHSQNLWTQIETKDCHKKLQYISRPLFECCSVIMSA